MFYKKLILPTVYGKKIFIGFTKLNCIYVRRLPLKRTDITKMVTE